jgi:hypothetical protein
MVNLSPSKELERLGDTYELERFAGIWWLGLSPPVRLYVEGVELPQHVSDNEAGEISSLRLQASRECRRSMNVHRLVFTLGMRGR